MKNVKINLDRPPVDSKSIQASKDFNGLMQNHAIMSKPFYKSPWFFGATGLASVSLIAGIVAYNYQDPVPDETTVQNVTTESAPPDNMILAINSDLNPKTFTDDLVKETFKYSEFNQHNTIDNTPTFIEQSESNQTDNNSEEELETTEDISSVSHEEKHEEIKKDPITSLMPKISGKANGPITKDELFDNKGITTESDVNVIHFELHLIDGLGGKTMIEESNQLNAEMKDALKKINQGETIYFENIKAKTEQGDVVRLNPLRYVLMN